MKRPVDYVDPLIDTANRRFFFLTSACRPFGMVNLSPDTRAGNGWNKAGYRYDDEHVHWFSHVHAWQLCGIPVMPTTGECRGHAGSQVYRSRYTHDREVAQAGYHSVHLDDYGIEAELTSTTRVGFHRYTFEKQEDAWVLFDVGAMVMMPMSDCQATWSGNTEVTGFVENEATRRRPKAARIYFCAQFDRPFVESRAWGNGEVVQANGEISGSGAGVGFRFDVASGDVLQLKVAISYCSVEQARLNLEAELPHWDFDAVRDDAANEWNDWLKRIEVDGGTEAQKTKFYTDLHHALKGRRRVSDANGKYIDMTGDEPMVRQIPLDDSGKPLYDHHNSDAFWGAAWGLNVLWGLAYPEVMHNFCNTFLDYYRNGGLIPRGPSGGNYTFVMTAPTSTTLFVSAWMRGIRTFDIDLAWEGLLKNHGPQGIMAKAGYEHDTFLGGGAQHYIDHGYVNHESKGSNAFHDSGTATMTLEYAFHDWALAQLAKALGKDAAYEMLAARTGNYRNVWDTETRHMRPRLSDGTFVEPFDPMSGTGFVEGNANHYRWYAPHDVPGLVELFGGAETFIQELDELFERARETDFVAKNCGSPHAILDYGNQPCTYIAHLFSHAGAPWLTQKWVHEVIDKAKSDITPHGGYNGDEDQGMMGALNALMSIGLFSTTSMCAENPGYELTTPLFDRITIHTDNDSTFTIDSPHSTPADHYIQSATFNGQPLDGFQVAHEQVIEGGVLKLALGPQPNKKWGVR